MIRTIERAHEWPAISTDFERKNRTRKTGTPGRRSSLIVPATLASNSTWCHAVASAPSAPHWWRCPEQADGCGCLLPDHLTRRPSWRFPDPPPAWLHRPVAAISKGTRPEGDRDGPPP